ncbi:MAG: HlyC/CorC family transporter [Candidatus Coatesbacteria bacterium]|nr:MAG: HlyC/CorC family transporter [Candidatus Coatesbacteria bacterium]
MAGIELITVVFCVVGAAFFEAVETAVLASNRLRMRTLANRGDKGAALVDSFLEKPERFLGTIPLGGNFCVIAGTALATALAARSLPPFWAAAVSTAGMTCVIVLFAQILPKSVSLQNPDYFARATAKGLNVAIYVLTPFTFTFTAAADLTLRVFGIRRKGRSPYVSREELRSILTEGVEDAPTVLLEKQMIRRIFRFGETKVAQAMVPLVDVVSIDETASIGDAVELISRHGYSRLPVYRERVDDVRGAVYARDLIGVALASPVVNYLRTVEFYPETKSIETALVELQASELRMAMVVDEYGGVVGLITLEDIAEEVAGEIEDEYDRVERRVVRRGDELYMGGDVEIDYLNEYLPDPLPKEDYETVAGFIIKRLERIPETGEEVEEPPYRFTILAATDRSVDRLKIRVPPGERRSETDDQV